jgi:hypothetical protein
MSKIWQIEQNDSVKGIVLKINPVSNCRLIFVILLACSVGPGPIPHALNHGVSHEIREFCLSCSNTLGLMQ